MSELLFCNLFMSISRTAKKAKCKQSQSWAKTGCTAGKHHMFSVSIMYTVQVNIKKLKCEMSSNNKILSYCSYFFLLLVFCKGIISEQETVKTILRPYHSTLSEIRLYQGTRASQMKIYDRGKHIIANHLFSSSSAFLNLL